MQRAEKRLQKMDDDLTLMKRALVAGSSSSGDSHKKVKVPDPKAFGGTRSANDLENFIWDMEQYFNAARILDDERVSITSMYLRGMQSFGGEHAPKGSVRDYAKDFHLWCGRSKICHMWADSSTLFQACKGGRKLNSIDKELKICKHHWWLLKVLQISEEMRPFQVSTKGVPC